MTAAAAGEPSTATTSSESNRFADAVASLRTRSQLPTADRALRVIGPVLMPLGVLVIFLGWMGAANTTRVFLQVPYLISGGLFGLGLIFAGGFLYFSRWLTDLVDDNRRHAHAAAESAERTAAALERIETLLASGAITATATSAAPPADAPTQEADDRPSVFAPTTTVPAAEFVATRKGALAHRADCALVAGRETRALDPDTDLDRCQICLPGE